MVGPDKMGVGFKAVTGVFGDFFDVAAGFLSCFFELNCLLFDAEVVEDLGVAVEAATGGVDGLSMVLGW